MPSPAGMKKAETATEAVYISANGPVRVRPARQHQPCRTFRHKDLAPLNFTVILGYITYTVSRKT